MKHPKYHYMAEFKNNSHVDFLFGKYTVTDEVILSFPGCLRCKHCCSVFHNISDVADIF